jgi:hypothetical protein
LLAQALAYSEGHRGHHGNHSHGYSGEALGITATTGEAIILEALGFTALLAHVVPVVNQAVLVVAPFSPGGPSGQPGGPIGQPCGPSGQPTW